MARPSLPASGAETALNRRTAALRSLAEAVVMVDAQGRVVDLVSGPSGLTLFPHGSTFWDVLEGTPATRLGFQFAFEQLVAGDLPVEVGLDQMPRKARILGRAYHLDFAPILIHERVVQVVVRIDDAEGGGDDAARNEANAEFRQIVELLLTNLEASRAFFGETRWFMEQLGTELSRPDLLRYLHTLKGNLGCFGFSALGSFIHHIEEKFAERRDDEAHAEVKQLREHWAAQEATYGVLFAGQGQDAVTLSRDEYEEVVMGLMCQADYAQLLGIVQRWAMTPISSTFARLAMQAQRIAGTLGLRVETVIDHGNVRLPATGLEPLFASLVHLVRNALDHGIGGPDARVAQGKAPTGVVSFRARLTDDDALISVGDDGDGVSWERVREKAAAAGLPHETEDDLIRALLSDGFSTRDAASEMSGRGVGTAAVQSAALALGGALELDSARGRGTTFTVRIPLASLATLGVLT